MAKTEGRTNTVLEEVLAAVRPLRRRLGRNHALLYWEVGAAISRLGSPLPRRQQETLGRRLRMAPRLLRYCTEVHAAFTDRDALAMLLRRGLSWSMVRELAAPCLADRRESLIESCRRRRIRTLVELKAAIGTSAAETVGPSDHSIEGTVAALEKGLGYLRRALEEAAAAYPDGFDGMARLAESPALHERILAVEAELRELAQQLGGQ